ncbi:YCF48-related protein [Ideonella sp. A 288]|uniref:WD40/YVTN/BNR-like repeat-containing protein n=1 Tax=Ideonella sp. A 288 TaxID=1962181 RepID=UPI000B4B4598|nr:YCF48-related protein [Ideonella sp. A 288]
MRAPIVIASLLAAALVTGLAWAVVGARAPAAVPAGHATLAVLASKNLLLAGARIGPRLVVVGEHGHVLVSDDRGKTWLQAKSVPTVTTLTALHFVDARRGWAVGHGGIVIATTDGGDHWTLQSGQLDGPEILFSVWFRSATEGLAVGAYGYAATTDDGGKTWKRFEIAEGEDGERHLNHIFAGPPGAGGAPASLWIAAESGLLFRSDDNARTWQKVALPYKGSIWGGTTLADGAMLVWGMRGNLLRSDDGGKTFASVPTGTDQSLGGGVQLPDGAVVLAGLGGVVVHSADGRRFESTVRDDRAGLGGVLPGPDGQVVLLGQGGVQIHPIAAAASAPR